MIDCKSLIGLKTIHLHYCSKLESIKPCLKVEHAWFTNCHSFDFNNISKGLKCNALRIESCNGFSNIDDSYLIDGVKKITCTSMTMKSPSFPNPDIPSSISELYVDPVNKVARKTFLKRNPKVIWE